MKYTWTEIKVMTSMLIAAIMIIVIMAITSLIVGGELLHYMVYNKIMQIECVLGIIIGIVLLIIIDRFEKRES